MPSPTSRPASRAAALFKGTESSVTIGDWLRFSVSLLNREGLEFAQGTLHAGDEDADG